MLMTSSNGLSVIGYKICRDNRTELSLKCEECKEVIVKRINLNKITNVYCKKCGNRWSIIPIEVNNNSGELIDFRIESYFKINKLLHNKDIKEKLNNITDKNEKNGKILNIIQGYYTRYNKD